MRYQATFHAAETRWSAGGYGELDHDAIQWEDPAHIEIRDENNTYVARLEEGQSTVINGVTIEFKPHDFSFTA